MTIISSKTKQRIADAVRAIEVLPRSRVRRRPSPSPLTPMCTLGFVDADIASHSSGIVKLAEGDAGAETASANEREAINTTENTITADSLVVLAPCSVIGSGAVRWYILAQVQAAEAECKVKVDAADVCGYLGTKFKDNGSYDTGDVLVKQQTLTDHKVRVFFELSCVGVWSDSNIPVHGDIDANGKLRLFVKTNGTPALGAVLTSSGTQAQCGTALTWEATEDCP